MLSNRLLKNAHLRRIPARSPSHGRARSCSLFVATAPLILALLDEEGASSCKQALHFIG